MKNINELLRKVPGNLLQGKLEGEITELVYDSRKITDGCAFVCLKGASFDGHTFAAEAAAKGARLIVVEDDVDLSQAADASQTAGASQAADASIRRRTPVLLSQSCLPLTSIIPQKN